MIYNKEYETMPREDLEQIQIERLQSTLNRVYRNVAHYKNKFDECNINIEKIKNIKDIKELPFTTKEDLRNSYPYDMFAVPLKDIVRIHSSRGRTGKPIAIGYTRNDLTRWSEQVARLLIAIGIDDHDFVQIAFDYSMYTGGFGFHYGAENIGASVIPSSTNSRIQDQILLMKDYKTTVLLSTPSYAIDLGNNLKEMGIHPEELNLRLGLFGAEPWGEKVRETIEEKLHISAFNNYGVNEIMGPGVACECDEKNGLHVNEDHFIVEIIDPETLEPVEDGKEGELVFTTITREGFPLIRYRTGDRTMLLGGECACTRTTRRIARVAARVDDMIVIRGINVFPVQIDEVLKKAEGIEPHFQVVLENEEGIDTMEIKVVVSDDIFNDEVKKMMELKNRISGLIEDELGISAKISLVEQETLRDENVEKVVDNR
ncbi:MAG: phenylacetate--CoA ligase [bacterium]|nr:phenylacetate--CoA ligase [bacterium]